MQEATGALGPDDATLTVDKFAEAVGVHPMTARRWIRAGFVTVERTPTGRIRIPAGEVKAVMTVHEAKRDADDSLAIAQVA